MYHLTNLQSLISKRTFISTVLDHMEGKEI